MNNLWPEGAHGTTLDPIDVGYRRAGSKVGVQPYEEPDDRIDVTELLTRMDEVFSLTTP